MQIKDIMTKRVVSVTPETSLLEAADILTKKTFTGIPVVDSHSRLVGIFTEYDLLLKGSRLHMPTFLSLLQTLPVHSKDKPYLREDLKKILNLRVKDIMNDDPLTLNKTQPIEDIVQAFAEHHRVNPIPIVDKERKLVGIVSRYDVIKFYAPHAPSSVKTLRAESDIESQVDTFIRSFRKHFVFVASYRTRWWLLLSALFFIVGFVVALFLTLRIVIHPN